MIPRERHIEYLLRLADSPLVLSHRLSEWCGHGPVLEEDLALANIAEMLKPGGFLLSNNALPEIPGSPMQSVDYLTVVYSDDRPDDGDHIVWYQRRPEK